MTGRGPSPEEVLRTALMPLTDVLDPEEGAVILGWGVRGLAAALAARLSEIGYRLAPVNEDWREGISSREALRSELIRQHLAGECGRSDV